MFELNECYFYSVRGNWVEVTVKQHVYSPWAFTSRYLPRFESELYYHSNLGC